MAPPELYSSLHTLSLPDALPISLVHFRYVPIRPRSPVPCQGRRSRRSAVEQEIEAARQLLDQAERVVVLTGAGISTDRSEEHTSELQSLMRISYDVFCLKNKNSLQSHSIHKTIRVYA